MKLHIAGIEHFDPLCKGRLQAWLQELHKKYSCSPDFVAVEWDQHIFKQVLPLDNVIASIEDSLDPRNHELAFQLFQIPTLGFAYSASTQRKQQKFMGIRKGLFG
ncbi:MAG: hypothetical protein HY695_25685 [Deltaproteobacteria bacterium]|nr:hypothetical protein [Deltaproteobacteria bacterium]